MNRYLSMISISSVITGGAPSMKKLRQLRPQYKKYLFALLIATMACKYSLKVIDIITNVWGVHRYVQLWNGGRTMYDKLLESIMIHGISIVFTLSIQLTLCTLFLTFWREEGYFVMSYIPGIGFVMFFVSFVLFSIGMVLDRVMQWMVQASDKYIYMFWLVWCLWMVVVTIPMIGYCAYVIQFVLEVQKGRWLRTEPFSPEFVHHSKTLCQSAQWFFVVALVELIAILRLDIEEGKSRRRS